VEPGKAIEVPSERYGKYLVRSRIGMGGMAEVYLAETVDRLGDQLHVALKLMRKDAPVEAFAEEADLMGMLSHPNLVQRLEVGEAYGRPYIAMEYLAGGDLRKIMDAHRREMKDFPTRMGVYVVLEVLKGLAHVHNARSENNHPLGLVHGDVNPSNIFFSDLGEVKLGDFGVVTSRHMNIGPRGMAAGKLHYLSPEQTRAEPLTPASDLFQLGVVLHELAVGYHPFEPDRSDPRIVMESIQAGKVSLPNYVDKPLGRMIQKALEPAVGSRYGSAGEFAGDLLRYALDNEVCPSPREVQEWLQSMLGLVV
jgi:eukaryotic-like serine/threonine-protein kinase